MSRPGRVAPAPGSQREVIVRPRLSVIGQAAAIESAIDGHGITRVSEVGVRKLIEKGQLVPLLTGFQPPSMPVHVLATRARLSTNKVRTFVTFAVSAMRKELADIGEAVDRALSNEGLSGLRRARSRQQVPFSQRKAPTALGQV